MDKLCRITKEEGLKSGNWVEMIRVDWIEDKEGKFTQKHITVRNDDEANLTVAILNGFGFRLVDNFDEVSEEILEKAGFKMRDGGKREGG